MTRFLSNASASLAAVLLMAGSFAVVTSVPAQTAHAQVTAPVLA